MTEEELRAICKGCRERYPDLDCRGCPNYADVELVQHEQSQADRIAELQAYRATGLTVERAAELGKADREGRVIVLNEKTALALAAGSRAIRVSNLNHGTTYCYCTEESVKKIRYAEAEKIIFDLAEKVL